jgi:hypothetical protein
MSEATLIQPLAGAGAAETLKLLRNMEWSAKRVMSVHPGSRPQEIACCPRCSQIDPGDRFASDHFGGWRIGHEPACTLKASIEWLERLVDAAQRSAERTCLKCGSVVPPPLHGEVNPGVFVERCVECGRERPWRSA